MWMIAVYSFILVVGAAAASPDLPRAAPTPGPSSVDYFHAALHEARSTEDAAARLEALCGVVYLEVYSHAI